MMTLEEFAANGDAMNLDVHMMRTTYGGWYVSIAGQLEGVKFEIKKSSGDYGDSRKRTLVEVANDAWDRFLRINGHGLGMKPMLLANPVKPSAIDPVDF